MVLVSETNSGVQRATAPDRSYSSRARPRRLVRRWRRSALAVGSWRLSPWLGVALASGLLVQVNGPLVASAGVGLLTYRQLHQLTPQQWEHIRHALDRVGARFESRAATQRPPTLLLSGGVMASLYMMLTLWQSTQSFWTAVALSGQTVLSVWIVGLLLRSRSSSAQAVPPENRQADPIRQFEQGLERLHHADALQRLMAVRYLLRQVSGEGGHQIYVALGEVSLRSHLTDCLRLMLASEPEPMVREAIKQGLHLLNPPPQLPEGAPAVTLPRGQTQTQRVRRAVVEYVEP